MESIFSLLDFCDNKTVTINATTTTVTVRPTTSCNFSIGNNTLECGTIANLTPGTVYQVFFSCWNCCKNATTRKYVCCVQQLLHNGVC